MKRLLSFVLIATCFLSLFSCSREMFLWKTLQEEASSEAPSSQSLYDQLLGAMESGAKSATLRGEFSEEQLKQTYRRIQKERPDLFWLGSSWKGTLETSSSGQSTARLTFSYYGEKKDNLQKQALLLEKAKDLAAACEGLPLYDQLLLVHDSIINACQYDQDSADEITQNPDSNDVLLASTAYGCLVEGKAVCSGYAAAFFLVMQELSIPCRRVSGTAYGQLHEWNLVQVEGEWVHVDLTWDDPTAKDGTPILVYDYFCIPDREILLSHTPDEDQALPDCDFADYGWYQKNALTLASADSDAVLSCLRRQITEGRSSYHLKFTENAKACIKTITGDDFLRTIQQSLNLRLHSYRINALNNAVEFFPATEQ